MYLLLDGLVDHNLGSKNPLPCSFEERLARLQLFLDRWQLGFVLNNAEGVLEGLRMDTVLTENSDGGLHCLASATASAATVTGERLGNCNGATPETVFGRWGTEGFWPCTADDDAVKMLSATGLPLGADRGGSAPTGVATSCRDAKETKT